MFCWPRYNCHQSQTLWRDLYCSIQLTWLEILFVSHMNFPEDTIIILYIWCHTLLIIFNQICHLQTLDRQERVMRNKFFILLKFLGRTIHHVRLPERPRSLCEPATPIFLCNLVDSRLFRYLFLHSFSRTKILLRGE